MDIRTATEGEIEKHLADLEAQLAQSNPGILDVMLVYGNAEAAVRQAADYLAQFDMPAQLPTMNAVGV